MKALHRLWKFAFCNHYNTTRKFCGLMGDTDELVWCRACGRILSWTESGERSCNPNRPRDPLSVASWLTWTGRLANGLLGNGWIRPSRRRAK